MEDDGLYNPHRWKHGTNKHFPCGHQRSVENTSPSGLCRSCRRRMDARIKSSRRLLLAEAQA